ncbi:PREDICTED: glycosylphosphatidylinositol anchor attachment 1 protein-like [Priapulus caudatus]|uniref:Glycosylphosphatidylinositol anchor attachment 1 protein-like n=1 Tax=Priapulus caudatus TaxID=37621 RepID=A0ABM1EKK5_PRICU|nr:PREDICTED: glycosylphosphatidylinositol anchor attachment 1 protein-like [Priapulus caudatus]
MPASWLSNKFMELGLEVYSQNFSMNHPLKKHTVVSGTNVYAIMRAPRMASTEAVVLNLPFRKSNLPGVALSLAVAKYFRRHAYWAKDVIFLVSEQDQLGVLAWLDAYHHHDDSNSDFLKSSNLESRAGSILAAISLEILADRVTTFDMQVEGLDGQLPNLDLFNLAVRLCHTENISPTFHGKANHRSPRSQKGYIHALTTMLSMVITQASGQPSGNHGLFQRFNIEAVSMVGSRQKGTSYGFKQMGRVVEGIVRSLNNLLERFHQSFFFYLLPSTDRYVSIGMYMPPFGLIVIPAVIKALALWIQMSTEQTANDPMDQRRKLSTDGSTSESGDSANKNGGATLLSVLPMLTMAHLMGVGLYIFTAPTWLLDMYKQLPTDHLLFYSIMSVGAAALFFPKLVMRHGKPGENIFIPSPDMLRCVALLELSLVLGTTSVMNFSLAAIIGIFTVPVLVCLVPRRSRVGTLLQMMVTVMVAPPVLLYIVILSSKLLVGVDGDVHTLAIQSYEEMVSAVFSSVTSGCIYGDWTYGLVTVVLFPIWLLFWCLVWGPVEEKVNCPEQ